MVGGIVPEPAPHSAANKPVGQCVGAVQIPTAVAAEGPQGVVRESGAWGLGGEVDRKELAEVAYVPLVNFFYSL